MSNTNMLLTKSHIDQIWEALGRSDRSKVVGIEAYLQSTQPIYDNIINALKESPDLTDIQFDKFCEKVRNKIASVRYSNDTFIGVRTAQDIMQPITQSKLSSFYTVGLGNETHDTLNLYKKLISNTENPSDSICYIYFKHLTAIGDLKMHSNKFIYLVFNDFVESTTVYSTRSEKNIDIPESCEFPVVRIVFSKQKMFKYKITLSNLASVLINENLSVVPSDTEFNEIYINNLYDANILKSVLKSIANVFCSRLDINNNSWYIKNIRYKMKIVSTNSDRGRNILDTVSVIDASTLYEKFSYVMLERLDDEPFDDDYISNISEIVIKSSDEGGVYSSRDNNILYIVPNFGRSHIENLLINNTLKPHIGTIGVCGIPGITDIDFDFDLDIGKAFIKAKGANLRRVLSIPGIDIHNTWSTSVKDTYEALGLEAAVRIFKRQMTYCIPQGSRSYQMMENVDLVANSVSTTGEIVGINRKGIEKAKGAFITLITFENAFSSMYNTAKGCGDDLKEIASCIVTGKRIKPYVQYNSNM